MTSSKHPTAGAAGSATTAPTTATAVPNTKGKVVLAYSGGLDTSCILAWLIEQGYEVVAFLANVGQHEDFEAARSKALSIGATSVHIPDLREKFLNETIIPATKANAVYEGIYLLGTALARPVIAEAQIDVAREVGAQFLAHGCTGKGNDQVRFELAFYALEPSIKVIAPWRLPEFYDRFQGRQDLLEYAAEKGIPVSQTKASPWSTDENMFHISYEAGVLENPAITPPDNMWRMTASLENAPNEPENIAITFDCGAPTVLQCDFPKGEKITGRLEIFERLNRLGCTHGIGRIDIIENRFIGVKSRGCYETPGGTILRDALRDLEGLSMDREVRDLRDFMGRNLAMVLYNGYWFSPERHVIMAAVEKAMEHVHGTVQLKLYKGNVKVVGRTSMASLYDEKLSSMDEAGGFNQTDSSGFIAIKAIRLKAWTQSQKSTSRYRPAWEGAD